MKKTIAIFLISICSVQSGFSQSDSYDFRKAKWGMSINDVIKSEDGNKYEIENEPSSTYLKLLGVSLTNITGYADLFYKFTNNSLVSVRMILYQDFQGSDINCNNLLPLATRISLVQDKYFTSLLKKGFVNSYTWEAETTKLFSDDERGRNPMVKPEEVDKAYLELKSHGANPSREIACRLKSDRTSMLFVFIYHTKNEPYYMGIDCDHYIWKHIVRIEASANSAVLKKDINPDI